MARVSFNLKNNLGAVVTALKAAATKKRLEEIVNASAGDMAEYLATNTPVATGEAAGAWAKCAAELGRTVTITPREGEENMVAEGMRQSRVDRKGEGSKLSVKLHNLVRHAWVIENGVRAQTNTYYTVWAADAATWRKMLEARDALKARDQWGGRWYMLMHEGGRHYKQGGEKSYNELRDGESIHSMIFARFKAKGLVRKVGTTRSLRKVETWKRQTYWIRVRATTVDMKRRAPLRLVPKAAKIAGKRLALELNKLAKEAFGKARQ